jgi:hypothetical protein
VNDLNITHDIRQGRYQAFLDVLAAMDSWVAEECPVAGEVLLIRVRQLVSIGFAWKQATQEVRNAGVV